MYVRMYISSIITEKVVLAVTQEEYIYLYLFNPIHFILFL